MRLLRIIASEDYRIEHTAPDRESGAPLSNLSGMFPEDVYSSDGPRFYPYYGDARDNLVFSIIRECRGRPNMRVKIYRAVPKVLSRDEKIQDIEARQKYILKYGKNPPDIGTALNKSVYYEILCEDLEKLKKLPEEKEVKITINPGDWVALDRRYAVEHGQASLGGKYRILTKTVKAGDLYTAGDFHEWGWDPR